MRATYEVRHSYPGAIDQRTYAGTDMLVPCPTVRVEATLEIPPELRGKRLRAKVVLEERK